MVEIKNQITNLQLENNIKLVLNKVIEISNTEDYSINLTSEELNNLKFNFEDLSRNARKKLSKRIFRAYTKNGIGTLNRFFHFLKKIGVIDELIKLDYSEKEKKIKSAKQELNKAKDIYLKALDNYKSEKGDFYKVKS